MSRPLREGVGRNRHLLLRSIGLPRRPLREGVGRNENVRVLSPTGAVALYARAWVEITVTGLISVL